MRMDEERNEAVRCTMDEKRNAAMERCALIVSGGTTDPAQLAAEYEKLKAEKGILIAADSGLEAIRKAGAFCKEECLPDYAVGDFDSVTSETYDYFKNVESICFERHRPEKDESDTELAFRIAREAGCTNLTLMGVTGTRLDHTLSNIHLLLTARKMGLSCMILDRHNRIRLAVSGMRLCSAESPFRYVSFLPLSEEVTGLTLTGFQYPLQNYQMVLGKDSSLCVSNELHGEGMVTFSEGTLLMVESRD